MIEPRTMPRVSHHVHPLRPTEDGIVCKHGPEECKASIMELCAQETHPDPRTNVGFVECLTHEFERIPERAHYEACASKFSIDLEAVDHCATRDEGAYGFKLLRESAQHTIDVSENSLPSVLADDNFLSIFCGLSFMYKLTSFARWVCVLVAQFD